MSSSARHEESVGEEETWEERWQRLRSCYSDEYLNLLNKTVADKIELAHTDLETTRLGCVIWSALEKEKFFRAISRKSKAHIREVAKAVGSKTELEVYAYLHFLEEEDWNQQLYAGQVANVDDTDIPAAVEVSRECEVSLEDAADALAIHQESFDRTHGEQSHQDLWLIDSQKAGSIDKLVDDAENGHLDEDGSRIDCPVPAGTLFKLSSWVSLIEDVFMRSTFSRGGGDDLIHAAADESPAITQDAVAIFYELALRRLRHLTQTSLFCAESRQRRMLERGHNAPALVKLEDIATAIDLLGMKEDRVRFWVELPRRNGLQVLDDRKRKKGSAREHLKYDEVERILSIIPRSLQRRRSTSTASRSLSCLGISPNADDSDSDVSNEAHVHASNRPSKTRSSIQDAEEEDVARRSSSQGPATGTSSASGQESSNSDSSDEGTSNSDDDDADDDDSDVLLEAFDQAVSREAELRLYSELAWTMPADPVPKDGETFNTVTEKPRPVLGKPRVEFQDWRESIQGYTQDWEEYDTLVDEFTLMENQRRLKRRKINTGVPQTQDLPFRTSHP